MKNIKKLIALSTVFALCMSQVQAQDDFFVDESAAYSDSGRASYWAAAIPIGAVVVAAIIIATTNNHHHGSSSSSSSGHHSSSMSSSSFSHN